MKKVLTFVTLFLMLGGVASAKTPLQNMIEKNYIDNITNLPLFTGNTKKQKKLPISQSLFQFLQSGRDGHEIEINNEKYFAFSGCRYQSCDEKGLIWVDKKNNITIGLLVHYFFNSNAYNHQSDFLVFSKNLDSSTTIPKEFLKAVKEWNAKAIVYSKKKWSPITPKKIRFINSKNEITDITELFKSKIK